MIKRLILIIFLAAVVAGVIIGYPLYKTFFLPNVPAELSTHEVYLSTGWDFDEVLNYLDQAGVLMDTSTFRVAAKRMNYIKDKMRSGRFLIQENWTNVDLIRHLRGGKTSSGRSGLDDRANDRKCCGKSCPLYRTRFC